MYLLYEYSVYQVVMDMNGSQYGVRRTAYLHLARPYGSLSSLGRWFRPSGLSFCLSFQVPLSPHPLSLPLHTCSVRRYLVLVPRYHLVKMYPWTPSPSTSCPMWSVVGKRSIMTDVIFDFLWTSHLVLTTTMRKLSTLEEAIHVTYLLIPSNSQLLGDCLQTCWP